MKDVCVDKLNSYVRVQKLLTTSDGMGGRTSAGDMPERDQKADDPKWVEWFGFWAAIGWSQGVKIVNSDRIQTGIVCKMEARWDPRLTSKERLILEDGKVILLESVTDREMRHEWMDIRSKAGVGT